MCTPFKDLPEKMTMFKVLDFYTVLSSNSLSLDNAFPPSFVFIQNSSESNLLSLAPPWGQTI